MQFISMEVSRHGSSDQLQLGKLSPGLNAICGPNGSGKSTLLNWLRQLTTENGVASPWSERPNAMRAPQYGAIEIQNQQNVYRIVQSASGQVNCQVAGAFGRVGYLSSTATALTPEQQRAFGELTSIHHGVDNINRLESLAQRLGIDQPAINPIVSERQLLLSRQTDSNTRLRALEGLRSTREGLLSRRGQLEAELHRVQRESQTHRGYGVLGDRERMEENRSALTMELRDVRAELAALERDIAGHRSGWSLRCGHQELDIGSTYREQLEQLDARLDRWRQTLRDLRAHRERLEHNATDARLDKQIGDQLSISKTADPRAALRSLESQLLAASQQIEALVDRSDRSYESYHAQSSLPESLRNMQRDLYEVCQQLARQESTTAAESLRQQATQLARSESELLQSVEKLIDERAALLHRIADEYHLSMDQLTLAFGDWCECHDHPHLSQWLLNEAPGAHTRTTPDKSAQEYYSEETRLWEQRRIALQNRIAELQSQLKESESQLAQRRQPKSAKSLRSEADVARDLDKVVADLRDLEDRDRLRVELDEIRRALAKLPVELMGVDRFRQLVNKHLDGLLGGRANGSRYKNAFRPSPGVISNSVQSNTVHSHTAVYLNSHANKNGSQNGLQNGLLNSPAPAPVIELAMRLAIVEVLFERGQPVSLLVDGPLDHLPVELQQNAVSYLEAVAATGQQVVLFSSDERVAELVRSARGWVGYMHEWKATRVSAKPAYAVPKPAYDVNRQLLAFANDHEADKWYEPVVPRQRLVRRAAAAYRQLTEASLVEECPSVDATSAARLRALGIDRVGDLLTTDPRWLADHLRLSGVSNHTVMRWQAEAKLLCSVPQLRPFDARVLAGAGVRHPRQLAELPPSQLLDRVERFLATDRGREILRSGNSYELSRITAWIASAKSGEGRHRPFVASVTRPARSAASSDGYFGDAARDEVSYRSVAATRPAYDYDVDVAANQVAGSDRWLNDEDFFRVPENIDMEDNHYERTRTPRPTRSGEPSYSVVNRDYEPRERQARQYETRDHDAREPRGTQSREHQLREPRARDQRETRESSRSEMQVRAATERDVRKPRQATVEVARTTAGGVKGVRPAAAAGGRFYLDLSSPVVDAPSIGPRIAEKLALLGIETVEDFLAGNAESLASQLDVKRMDSATIRDWQDQARLVCRIPNLRGHDAQLLVACKVTSPEDLSQMNSASLLGQVTVVAKSSEGQRMLRGSQAPDLAEVADWIHWATNSRSLNAA